MLDSSFIGFNSDGKHDTHAQRGTCERPAHGSMSDNHSGTLVGNMNGGKMENGTQMVRKSCGNQMVKRNYDIRIRHSNGENQTNYGR
ncbi:hypothetical protein WGH24286_00492 [Periweissella ghanensis]|uniref:Uncharacterized protein n=1 Tax=Periweissella ghanensis TaxID=467997 RepID=A0ABM8Z9T3_9LACO|nr:hypothetical protein WGH24286_00492 [Periweissella ghanensis]